MSSHRSDSSEPPLLALQGITRRFGSIVALDGVELDFHSGEVHAVLGENGAGKSTLMNVLYGLVRPDRGTIRLRGRPVRFASALDARRAGIGMVHQEFSLVNALSVAENLTLSLAGPGTLIRNERAVSEAARRLADDVGLEIPPLDVTAGSIPVGSRQRIEILKALAGRTDLLILDEPTAVLTPAETSQLFTVLSRLRERGTGIAFITHRLSEVLTIADRVTVMRRGRVVARLGRDEASEADLARMMVGDLPRREERRRAQENAEPTVRLRLRDLSAADDRGLRALCHLHLELRSGEVLAIAGVDGNGQAELFDLLAGLRKPTAGSVEVEGKEITRFDPGTLTAAGIGSIPPDRVRQGTVAPMSVQENVVLSSIFLGRLACGPFLSPRVTRRVAERLVDTYSIKTESLDAPVASLSGGNLQRLVVARALALEPRVLVAFNPTRGLDVGAASAVYTAIDDAVRRGTAVLLISTDLDEVLTVGDRAAVLFRGRLSDVMDPPFSLDRLGALMAGVGTATG